MSRANCDGTVSTSFTDDLFGDSVLSDWGISDSSFGGISGAPDPRPIAAQQAVGQIKAQGFDPCAADEDDDLQNAYHDAIPSVWASIQGTPNANPIQAAVNDVLGTSTGATPTLQNVNPFTYAPNAPKQPSPTSPTNWALIIGAVAVVGIGVFLVFHRSAA